MTVWVAQAVAGGPVAHLVVVLDEGDEGLRVVEGRGWFDGGAPVFSTEGGVVPSWMNTLVSALSSTSAVPKST